MTVAAKKLTFAEYLNYDDGTDHRYELVDGELVNVPTESWLNEQIALWLLTQFIQFIPVRQISRGTEIAVTGKLATTRIPDLMVLSDELASCLASMPRSVVTFDMPPPDLVIEVVSPGKENYDRNYRYKRSEYAARKILEYWIIDPPQARMTVLILVEGIYEGREFQGREPIISLRFPHLTLTAQQILAAGQVVS